jgi:hypothetical protein
MAADLAVEAAKAAHEYHREIAQVGGNTVTLEVLYLPEAQRVGYATNGPAEWADAQSLEDAVGVARAGSAC